MEEKTAETLLDLICKHVVPGTELWTDVRVSYYGLTALGHNHQLVNHTENFDDLDTDSDICGEETVLTI